MPPRSGGWAGGGGGDELVLNCCWRTLKMYHSAVERSMSMQNFFFGTCLKTQGMIWE